MLKFTYFLADGKNSSSSYHQAYVYLGHIEKCRIELKMRPFLPDAFWPLWLRCLRGTSLFASFGRKLFRLILIPIWRLMQLSAGVIGSDGILVGNCMLEPHSSPWMERLIGACCRRMGKPFILYLPDAMQIDFPEQYEQRFRASTHLISVTPWLQGELARKGFESFLSRVALDVTRYPMCLHRQRAELVMGFSGNTQNFNHLLELEDALYETLQQFPNLKLRIVSRQPPHFINRKINFEFAAWKNEDPYRSRFELGVEEMLDFDIALAPLKDEEYSLGKDSCKLRQYMALGLAVVGSNVGVNSEILRHGINGFLARSPEDWCSSIAQLVESSETRRRIGHEARKTVEREFDVRVQAPLLGSYLRNCVEQNA